MATTDFSPRAITSTRVFSIAAAASTPDDGSWANAPLTTTSVAIQTAAIKHNNMRNMVRSITGKYPLNQGNEL
jgi:hypothetical protein